MALPVLECIDFVSDVGGLAGLGWDWLALVVVGGRATPAHPPKRRHFTPNPAKRPVWKRFGVKYREKSFEIPPFSGSVEPQHPQQHPKSCDIASGCEIFAAWVRVI
ncbi:hypothetical protein CIP101352_00033 [Corynebacterium diphtheriae]|nr:hypothetical protein CIP101352_00033 [Corynebacterium diphtheriae]